MRGVCHLGFLRDNTITFIISPRGVLDPVGTPHYSLPYRGNMASWTGFLSAMLCIRSEPTTASFTDDMTAFHFNPAKSMWTLLIAAVVWTATNMISGIKWRATALFRKQNNATHVY